MSRLGDLIRTERLRSKMTPKQVARKCGVSESYLLAVEAGTKIIADDQARRIQKTIGLREQTEADFSLDDIAAMLAGPEIDRQLLESKADELDQTIRRLSAIRDGLRHAAVCPADNHLACPKFQRLMDIAAKQAAKGRHASPEQR